MNRPHSALPSGIARYLRLATTVGFASLLCGASPAWAQVIGNAQSFAVVGGSGITAGGAGTTINGNVGSPGAITGIPANATITPPFINHGGDGTTLGAVADILILYNSAVMAPLGATNIGVGVNDLSLGTSTGVPGHYTPGRYTNAAGGVALLSTSITLDTPGTYVFTVANQLTAAGNVLLGAGVDPCTVFWRTGNGAAPTSISGAFKGTVVSDGTIAVNPGATVAGRTLTTATGPVTLAGGNTIGGCSGAAALLPTVGKAFSPATIAAGGVSTLTITLSNPNAAAISLTAIFTDTLPAGVVVAAVPATATTCVGVVTAASGGSSVSLASGSTIPAGSCTISVNVTAAVVGSYVNTIPVGAVQTSSGSNTTSATATLTVTAAVPTLPQAVAFLLFMSLVGIGYVRLRRRSRAE